MANSKFKIKKGAKLAPQSSGSNAEKGDLEVLDSDSRLHYHDGTSDRVLVDQNTAETLTNKSIDADSNTITNIEDADIKAAAAIDATKIADGSVDNTEFQHLDGATGNIQAQLDENTQDILDNDADIATNAGNISTNSGDITTLQSGKQDAFSGLTDDRLIRADGATNIQDSAVTLSNAGAMSGLTSLDIDSLNLNGSTITSLGPINLISAGSDNINLNPGNSIITVNEGSELRFEDGDASEYVSLKAPATAAGTLSLTLPDADGASGDALITDGSGNLSFTTISGGGGGGGGSYSMFDSTPQSVAAAGTITVSTSTDDLLQTRRVQGNTSGSEIAASITPFGTTPPNDGAMIILIGQNDAQPLKLAHNDAADGCILNGDAVLHANDVLKLQWDATADRYIEVSRSF